MGSHKRNERVSNFEMLRTEPKGAPAIMAFLFGGVKSEFDNPGLAPDDKKVSERLANG